MAVTIKDVAKEVGVAPSTVSRVIQDSPSISEETKEKVRKAMKKLGYVPNIAAQNLVRGLTNSIGVVFPPMDDERHAQPFFMKVLSAINQEAGLSDVTVAIATGSTLKELLYNVKLMFKQRRVDGFILLSAYDNDPVRDYLMEQKIPFVLIGTPNQHANEISYVDNDNQLLGKNAVDYLVSKGHRRIVFLTDTLEDYLMFERYFGYQRGMHAAGLNMYSEIYLDRKLPETVISFQEQIKEVDATAVIVMDDILGLRATQLLNMYGYKVPDDISVLSFNNSIFAELVHPYLSSFDIHVAELGQVALRKLTAEIRDGDVAHTKVIIPHELVQRESVLDLNK
ncbi:MAG: LacI family transcriptional regulator [Lactobacillales bacterium]|jgi:LacI family transcriptional regulator|nr:LacI family transcriptional regulator [Lactobacillales bacterium]